MATADAAQHAGVAAARAVARDGDASVEVAFEVGLRARPLGVPRPLDRRPAVRWQVSAAQRRGDVGGRRRDGPRDREHVEEDGQGGLELGVVDEKIDVAGGELALAGERLFVARILVAHAPAGERHGGVAPGEDDVGAGGQRRPHAAGR